MAGKLKNLTAARTLKDFTDEQINSMLNGMTVTVNDQTYAVKREEIARKWAYANGYHGASGGWIYDERGNQITQGWFSLWRLWNVTIRTDLFEQINALRDKPAAPAPAPSANPHGLKSMELTTDAMRAMGVRAYTTYDEASAIVTGYVQVRADQPYRAYSSHSNQRVTEYETVQLADQWVARLKMSKVEDEGAVMVAEQGPDQEHAYWVAGSTLLSVDEPFATYLVNVRWLPTCHNWILDLYKWEQHQPGGTYHINWKGGEYVYPNGQLSRMLNMPDDLAAIFRKAYAAWEERGRPMTLVYLV